MPETFPETRGDQIARTTLTDRELLIHLTQHAEIQSEQLSELHEIITGLSAELAVYRPLLAKLAPGGKPDFVAVMQTRREARRGR